MCVTLGDSADHAARTGKARKISYDEALEILRLAEENVLMHQVNVSGLQLPFSPKSSCDECGESHLNPA